MNLYFNDKKISLHFNALILTKLILNISKTLEKSFKEKFSHEK